MRIISNFRDYYDCMQGYYKDDMVYIRNKTAVKKSKPDDLYNFISHHIQYAMRNSPIYRWEYFKYRIGFCGKIYTCYEIHPRNGSEKKLCYSHEDFKKYYPEESDELIEAFGPRCAKFRTEWFDWTQPQKNVNKFVENKCPIFVEYYNEIVYNDCLRNFDFHRIFNPALAYQELMMFFGSVLAAPEKSIPKIDDVTMAQAKGFDKYSFRKDKRK